MRQFAYVISCYSFRFSPLATFSCPGLILCAVKRPLDPWPAGGLPSYRSSFSFKTLSLESCPWVGQGSASPSREILSVTARGADRRAQPPRSRGQFRRWRRVCDAQVSRPKEARLSVAKRLLAERAVNHQGNKYRRRGLLGQEGRERAACLEFPARAARVAVPGVGSDCRYSVVTGVDKRRGPSRRSPRAGPA